MARQHTSRPRGAGRSEGSAVGLEELLLAADRAAESGSPAAREWIIEMIYDTLDRAVLRRSARRPAERGPLERGPSRLRGGGARRRLLH